MLAVREHEPLALVVTALPGTVLEETRFRHAPLCGTMAEAGNNLIVDTVLVSDNHLAECVYILAHLQVSFVGVYCNLTGAEKRESKRADRKPGLAR